MNVGILGGTGPAGAALAARLSSLGIDVVIGSRSAERAQETADKLKGKWGERVDRLRGGGNEEAAKCELVVVSTPWDAAAATAVSVSEHLNGKVVICIANALARVNGEFQPFVPPRGSVAAHVQAMVPEAKVAAALHHIPARELGDIDHPVESDVLVCSDRPEATKIAADLVAMIPGLVPLDAGTLSNAAPIEAFTAVLLQLNMRYKTHTALRITGIPKDRL
ncbi:MAG: NADPH-dependent F420 reductase [Acidimicrobiales bacterium]